jgi:hypothetical protein
MCRQGIPIDWEEMLWLYMFFIYQDIIGMYMLIME